jgi:hypothetical protein
VTKTTAEAVIIITGFIIRKTLLSTKNFEKYKYESKVHLVGTS